jgi:ABC-2 type transport system permease protein
MTLRHATRDCATMLRRNLRRMQRYPSMTFFLVGMPIIFLLLFVYVFGGTLGAGLGGAGAGLGGAGAGRSEYLAYLVPGILLMTVAGVAQGTAIAVAMDMNEGIIARFRTMAIFRPSVLTGHVVGSLVQAIVCLAVVVGVALLIGFRSDADLLAWIAAIGVLAIMAFAFTWLAVALGLVSDTVETASNLPMPLVLLPFLGSGFVPTESMPAGLRQFAEWQPFTPAIETLRGLLIGGAIGANGVAVVAWGAVIALGGYLWSRRLYNRPRTRLAA